MTRSEAPARSVEIAVIGAGPAGMIAALALCRAGHSVALIAPASRREDGRTTALLAYSREFLEKLDLWEGIAPHAAGLAHMRLIDDTRRLVRAPETTFNADELGLEAFGYNVLNHNLNRVLEAAVNAAADILRIDDVVTAVTPAKNDVTLELGKGSTLTSRLVVGADGRESRVRNAAAISVRRWHYPQMAMVLNLTHKVPHNNISTEFHTPSGPFTLVPLPGDMSSLVCVERPGEARRLMAMDDATLATELERRAHSVLGAFEVASSRQLYPLSGMVALKVADARCALMGEAAHVFPPIGAQGLNLSIRDISDLVRALKETESAASDPGSDAVLKAYNHHRMPDITGRVTGVDILNRSLLSGLLPVQAARSLGIAIAGSVPPLRKLLMKESISPRVSRFFRKTRLPFH